MAPFDISQQETGENGKGYDVYVKKGKNSVRN